ncbi:hypothetical protein GCM10010156_76820 [Planobispora rosea]|uniref:Uncharacterized protein n=1 Tax=Planobispora rosea TaxID=35762 RepID=A0A8J3SCB9_PLARO|nr:hypothetical protein GCM10010156_76820 [Planobispora rosea]GIH89199.1 hypothetical protein Pro02_76070 [Planobispora rosea]
MVAMWERQVSNRTRWRTAPCANREPLSRPSSDHLSRRDAYFMSLLGGKKPTKEAFSPPDPIPVRWVVIIGFAVAIGVLVGRESGSIAAGIGTGILLAGFLHTVMR